MYCDMESIMTAMVIVVFIMAGLNIVVVFLVLDHVKLDKSSLIDLIQDLIEDADSRNHDDRKPDRPAED